MSRDRRVFVPGGTYFFTVVTADRQPWFANSEHVDSLKCAFRRIKMDRPFEIDAIAVLPDHLHTIWRLPEGDSDFSGRWREIKKLASRYIAPCSDAQRERSVWQRRFWEHLIRDDDDWRRHVDYIHFNPVKHGLVTHPGAWPWSSFKRAVERGWYDAGWSAQEPAAIVDMDREWQPLRLVDALPLIHPTLRRGVDKRSASTQQASLTLQRRSLHAIADNPRPRAGPGVRGIPR